MFTPLPRETESMAKTVVDAAYKVHTTLGPGLLESVYEACLAHELRRREIPTETQLVIPIVYEGLRLQTGLRIDMLVDKKITRRNKSSRANEPRVQGTADDLFEAHQSAFRLAN